MKVDGRCLCRFSSTFFVVCTRVGYIEANLRDERERCSKPRWFLCDPSPSGINHSLVVPDRLLSHVRRRQVAPSLLSTLCRLLPLITQPGSKRWPKKFEQGSIVTCKFNKNASPEAHSPPSLWLEKQLDGEIAGPTGR